MPWGPPSAPTTLTTITVAFGTAVVNSLNWLRQLTGNADPGAANLVVVSTGPTTTTWAQVPEAAIAVPKVSRTGDTMTGDLQVNRASGAAPTQGYLVLGNNAAFYVGYDGAKHAISTPRLDILGDTYVYRAAASTTGYLILGTNSAHYVGFDGTNIVADGNKIWTDANDGAASGLDADLLDGVQGAGYALVANQVPSGLIGGFQNAAAIAAGWTRFTSGDGKFLIGAGTSFGQTFSEGASAGSTWDHLHGTTGTTVQSGSGTSAAAAANTANATWIPPSFTIVWAKKS